MSERTAKEQRRMSERTESMNLAKNELKTE